MNDFTLLLPEFLVTGLAFLVLTTDFFLRSERKHLLAYMSVLGLAPFWPFHWSTYGTRTTASMKA